MNDLSAAALWARLSAQFAAEKRLFALEGAHGLSDLMVERWTGREALSHGFEYTIDGLSPDTYLDCRNKPDLRKIRLSVFGFSRSGAMARAWVSCSARLPKQPIPCLARLTSLVPIPYAAA
jgi:hypothetical protein